MPLRKTEGYVLSWLAYPASVEARFKWSEHPIALLIARGLIEETPGGLVRITQRGREELRNWKGTL